MNSARPSRTTASIATYGPFVLALYLLLTTRWGSYVVPGPPFVSDLAIGGLIFERFLSISGRGRLLAPIAPSLGFAVGVLLTFSAAVLLLGEHSLDAARDAAPFAYGVLVYLTWPLEGRKAAVATRLLTVALYLHLLWVTLALVGAQAASVPTPGNDEVQFLALRSDMDGLVNGLAASVGLYRLLSNRPGAVLLGWGLILVLGMNSRVALIATTVMLLCAAGYVSAQRRGGWLRHREGSGSSGRVAPEIPARALFALSAAFVAVGLAVSIQAPTAVERLTGTFGEPGPSEARARAAGTTQARLKTWSALHDWTTEDPWRNVLGAGFGLNVMAVSGASIALLRSNDPDLRSPHNFLLTTWARLGLLGFAVVTLMFAVGLRLAAQVRKMPITDIDLIAGLLLVGLPIVALTGVVLESPFGAIPYFWALGHLGSRVEWHRRSENLPQQTQCVRPA